jgi:hypothetical protein
MACAPKVPSKAEDAYKAFKLIDGATAVGVNKMKFDELIQSASSELLILADIAKGTSDTLPLRYYQSALEIYKGAETIWANKVENSRWSFVPEDKIMVNADGEQVAQSNHLKVERIKYSTNKSDTYGVVSGDAIPQLWQLAKKQALVADSIVVARRPKT